MFDVSKEAAEYIRRKVPGSRIKVTSKNKSSKAKRYYVEETPAVEKALIEFESQYDTTRYGE